LESLLGFPISLGVRLGRRPSDRSGTSLDLSERKDAGKQKATDKSSKNFQIPGITFNSAAELQRRLRLQGVVGGRRVWRADAGEGRLGQPTSRRLRGLLPWLGRVPCISQVRPNLLPAQNDDLKSAVYPTTARSIRSKPVCESPKGEVEPMGRTGKRMS